MSSPLSSVFSSYFLTFTFLPHFFFLKIFLYFLILDFFTLTVFTEDPLNAGLTTEQDCRLMARGNYT